MGLSRDRDASSVLSGYRDMRGHDQALETAKRRAREREAYRKKAQKDEADLRAVMLYTAPERETRETREALVPSAPSAPRAAKKRKKNRHEIAAEEDAAYMRKKRAVDAAGLRLIESEDEEDEPILNATRIVAAMERPRSDRSGRPGRQEEKRDAEKRTGSEGPAEPAGTTRETPPVSHKAQATTEKGRPAVYTNPAKEPPTPSKNVHLYTSPSPGTDPDLHANVETATVDVKDKGTNTDRDQSALLATNRLAEATARLQIATIEINTYAEKHAAITERLGESERARQELQRRIETLEADQANASSNSANEIAGLRDHIKGQETATLKLEGELAQATLDCEVKLNSMKASASANEESLRAELKNSREEHDHASAAATAANSASQDGLQESIKSLLAKTDELTAREATSKLTAEALAAENEENSTRIKEAHQHELSLLTAQKEESMRQLTEQNREIGELTRAALKMNRGWEATKVLLASSEQGRLAANDAIYNLKRRIQSAGAIVLKLKSLVHDTKNAVNGLALANKDQFARLDAQGKLNAAQLELKNKFMFSQRVRSAYAWAIEKKASVSSDNFVNFTYDLIMIIHRSLCYALSLFGSFLIVIPIRKIGALCEVLYKATSTTLASCGRLCTKQNAVWLVAVMLMTLSVLLLASTVGTKLISLGGSLSGIGALQSRWLYTEDEDSGHDTNEANMVQPDPFHKFLEGTTYLNFEISTESDSPSDQADDADDDPARQEAAKKVADAEENARQEAAKKVADAEEKARQETERESKLTRPEAGATSTPEAAKTEKTAANKRHAVVHGQVHYVSAAQLAINADAASRQAIRRADDKLIEAKASITSLLRDTLEYTRLATETGHESIVSGWLAKLDSLGAGELDELEATIRAWISTGMEGAIIELQKKVADAAAKAVADAARKRENKLTKPKAAVTSAPEDATAQAAQKNTEEATETHVVSKTVDTQKQAAKAGTDISTNAVEPVCQTKGCRETNEMNRIYSNLRNVIFELPLIATTNLVKLASRLRDITNHMATDEFQNLEKDNAKRKKIDAEYHSLENKIDVILAGDETKHVASSELARLIVEKKIIPVTFKEQQNVYEGIYSWAEYLNDIIKMATESNLKQKSSSWF